MAQKDLRTYHRREATRESGYHTCEETTGGECVIKTAERYICTKGKEVFKFRRSSLELVELFEKGISMIAFGGYIYTNDKVDVSLEMSFCYEGQGYAFGENCTKTVEGDSWGKIGFHAELPMNKESIILDVVVKMTIEGSVGSELDFIAFDFDVVSKEEFFDISCVKSFYQKTYMHIPTLYYLRADLPFDWYLEDEKQFVEGRRVVLKSCNRCGRFLPINLVDDLNEEKKTIAFSLHCKKRAPCVHSTFRAYEIQNRAELDEQDLAGLKLEGNKVVSYHGHQLECTACKKFFVNAPLNPQRNPQQFKEDGLRRRAIEVLVNILLERNLVHFEFERKNKREFSRYIWEKFDKRCFKCGPDSDPIDFGDMALDHTLPLAYLYRLDETATCLCSSHNSQKSDSFPVDFYSEEELQRLSKITRLSLEELHTRSVNQEVLDLLVENIVWFYDEFLMHKEYQKVRDGIRTADKINDSLKRIIEGKVDLAEKYKNIIGHYPTSVTIK